MKTGERVVGWAEPRKMKTAAQLSVVSAILQTLVAVATAVLWAMLARDANGSLQRVLAVVCVVVMVSVCALMWWLAWLQWRAVRESWGALHAYADGDAVVLGNPFTLAFGRRKRFPRGDTVGVSVANGKGLGGELSVWTVSGTGARVVVKAPGPWTDERWHEFCEGLHRLGFTVTST